MLWFNSVLSLINFFSTSFEYDNVRISHEYETKQIRKKYHNKYIRLCSRKTERSPVLWTCENQGAQHIISMKKIRFLQSTSLHCSGPKHQLDHLLVYSVCKLVHKSSFWYPSESQGYVIISWLVQFLCVCVTVGPRLDMSKFTEGVWQTVNSRRVVQTGKPSSWTDKYM